MTIKQLAEKIDRLEALAKSRSRYQLIALGVGLLLLGILVYTVFKPKDSANTELLKALQDKVNVIEKQNLMIDSLLRVEDDKYKANRPVETRIKTRYEKIPADVRDLTKDQLRRQVTEY